MLDSAHADFVLHADMLGILDLERQGVPPCAWICVQAIKLYYLCEVVDKSDQLRLQRRRYW
jgi:hypothetical protein